MSHAPASKENVDSMVKLMHEHNKVTDYTAKHAGEYITCLDYILQSYFEIIQEDKRRVDSMSDIESVQERRAIYDSMLNVVKEADSYITLNVASRHDAEYSGSHHYSIQLRVGPPNLSHVPVIKLPSPYIDISAQHDAEIEVKYNFESIKEAKVKLTSVTWGFAFEIFKEPDQGFYCSNIVMLRLLKDGLGGTSEVFVPSEVDSQDNYVQIKFPLRVEPPQEKLYEHLKCAQFRLERDAAKHTITTRKNPHFQIF